MKQPTKASRRSYYQAIAGCLKWEPGWGWSIPHARYNGIPIIKQKSLNNNIYYYSYWIGDGRWTYLENLLERIDQLANTPKT